MSLQNFDSVLGFAAVMLTLSLVVTAGVQFIGALLRLRHGSLVWGLGQLFHQLGLDAVLARQLARHITVNSPALSSRAALGLPGGAEAITQQELLNALQAISTCQQGAALSPGIERWLKDLTSARATLAPDVQAITAELAKLFPAQATAAGDAVQRAVATGSELSRQVGIWFDAAMTRTADRFALMTRYVTVVLSAALVLLLGVDAVHMFKTLQADKELRATWVTGAEGLTKEASSLLAQQRCADAESQAVRQLAAKPETPAAAKAALLKALEARPPLASPAERKALLEQAGAGAETAALEAALRDALQACTLAAADEVKKRLQAATQSPDLLQGSVFSRAGETARDPGGMLLAWVLLSLGAPFWFNVLKTLTSLRPLVASRADAPAKPT